MLSSDASLSPSRPSGAAAPPLGGPPLVARGVSRHASPPAVVIRWRKRLPGDEETCHHHFDTALCDTHNNSAPRILVSRRTPRRWTSLVLISITGGERTSGLSPTRQLPLSSSGGACSFLSQTSLP